MNSSSSEMNSGDEPPAGNSGATVIFPDTYHGSVGIIYWALKIGVVIVGTRVVDIALH